MKKQASFIVSAEHVGERLDRYLVSVVGELSRQKIENLIKSKKVLVDSVVCEKPAYKLILGQKIQLNTIEQKQASFVEPKLEVIYQNEDVIVINKPAGLVVYPPIGRSQPSVVGALAHLISDVDINRPGVVHRLDKDTSGVMILARNSKTKIFLIEQFKTRQVQKQYIALVWGRLDQKEARVELPIARADGVKMRVDSQGKFAALEYKQLKQYQNTSLVQIKLLTGRTHQIRVQFKYLGHPLVGDKLYSKKPSKLNRVFLHAQKLAIKLPDGGKQTFEAPLPKELKNYLELL